MRSGRISPTTRSFRHMKSGAGESRRTSSQEESIVPSRCRPNDLKNTITGEYRMDKPATFLQKQGRKIVALVMVAALYLGARLPQLTDAEQAELASHYRFARHELPTMAGQPYKYI